MKRYLFILCVLVAVVPIVASAQEETLIGDGIESGGYGGPVVKFTSFAGNIGVIVGGRGGWIINHTFVLGGGYYGMASNIRIDGSTTDMEYGGFEFEYIWQSDRVLHFTVHVGIGGGRVQMIDPYNEDRFFYTEPTINLEVNLIKWFRINAGIGYLWVDNIQGMPGLSTSDVRSITGSIVFKFGWF